jgi:hypothetical protein
VPEALLHTHPGHPPLLIQPSAQASLPACAQRPNRARSTSAPGSHARRSTPCPCSAPRRCILLVSIEKMQMVTYIIDCLLIILTIYLPNCDILLLSF